MSAPVTGSEGYARDGEEGEGCREERRFIVGFSSGGHQEVKDGDEDFKDVWSVGEEMGEKVGGRGGGEEEGCKVVPEGEGEDYGWEVEAID